MNRPLYVAIEGPIGVGKTTLVHRLSKRMQAQIVLEAFEDNPFLERFYSDRDRYAFQTQLCFLMSRFHQQQELAQTDLFRPSILADYHLLKDRIFARLTLRDDELSLYDRIFKTGFDLPGIVDELNHCLIVELDIGAIGILGDKH